MRIDGERCALRPWAEEDVESLVRSANNRNVWRNLSDRFPHPYGRDEAVWWIANQPAVEILGFAIEVEGEAVGGIGCLEKDDVHRRTGGIGYWLGESFWGRGIVGEALGLFVPRVFETTDLVRLEAEVFQHNLGSARVLERNGFTHEGTHRSAAYKDGEYLDVLIYARLRPGIV